MFSIFGLSIAEIVKLQKLVIKNSGEPLGISESELVIKEAKLTAEKIIFQAQKESKNIDERKTNMEIQLRELIQTERELIRNYERDEYNS